MAIFLMYDHEFRPGNKVHADTLKGMDREARRIQRYLRWHGKRSTYFPEATVDDFWDALDDTTISDVTVIGLATLARVHVPPWKRDPADSKVNGMLSFYDAISRGGSWPAISHLKQGSFYQRTSGGMDMLPLNPPFAWGFMADRAKIWGVPQFGFYPSRWHVRPQAGLTTIASYFDLDERELTDSMSYARTKEIFGRRESIRARGYPVPKFLHPIYDTLRHNERLFELHQTIRKAIPFVDAY
ncbi:MAG TPA: hypothetical protein VMG38_17495 [Trebonia sp.]|nr:hypothetical protein [Trebonia sp.]